MASWMSFNEFRMVAKISKKAQDFQMKVYYCHTETAAQTIQKLILLQYRMEFKHNSGHLL